MKRIQKLRMILILIFAGAIAAQAGPSVDVTLYKTNPYDGATRINETIHTTALAANYSNDNLAEQLAAEGYVEYKFNFTYGGNGGTRSTPDPNPTAYTTSTSCNTSGYFTGPAGDAGWIQVTVTAHTCYENGTEIPGSVATKTASIEVDVVEVYSIDANKNPVCVLQNVTFTAVTNPTGYGNLVNWIGGGTPPSATDSSIFTTYWSTSGNKIVTALNKNITETVYTLGTFTIDGQRNRDIPGYPERFHISVWKTELTDSLGNNWDGSHPAVTYEWYNCGDGQYFSSGSTPSYIFASIFYDYLYESIDVRGNVYVTDHPTCSVFSNIVYFLYTNIL